MFPFLQRMGQIIARLNLYFDDSFAINFGILFVLFDIDHMTFQQLYPGILAFLPRFQSYNSSDVQLPEGLHTMLYMSSLKS
jgi:hypothetical protein